MTYFERSISQETDPLYRVIDFEVFKYLIEKGIDVNHTANNGKTLLEMVVKGPYPIDYPDIPKIVEFLIEKGTDVNCKD
jgi:ankyrin repeat protein